MVEAIELHGIIKGCWIGVKRISRCHPWHEGGWDPVPGSDDDNHCCSEQRSEALGVEKKADHIRLLLSSYQKLTGQVLLEPVVNDLELIEQLDRAKFALVSHGTESSPVFNYGNQTALDLFEIPWDEFTQLESRFSAESPNRQERAALLEQVEENGFIDNYRGVRISKTGHRFLIEAAVVWNVIDASGQLRGQAAAFDQWRDFE